MINRVDSNQNAIVKALRKMGFSVLILTAVKNGCPDLLCSKNKRNVLIEVKTKEGNLNEKQKEFRANWNAEIFVIRDVEDCIELNKLLTKK